MNEQIELIISISGLIAFVISVLFTSRYCFLKFQNFRKYQIISEEDYKRIRYLLFLYMGLRVPTILFMSIEIFLRQLISPINNLFYSIESLLTQPIYLVIELIPIYIAFLLFYRKHINPFNKIKLSGNEDDLNDSVKKKFNSIEFYNALSTVLPKGEKDDNYGLDYIPFMLQNVQDKRKRFQKSSSFFLMITISLSIFFVVITILFSYILLNESSIGIYSEVKNLTSEVENVNKMISILRVDITDDKYFMKTNSYNFDKLQAPYTFNLSDDLSQLAYEVDESITVFNKNGNLEKLAIKLKLTEDTLKKIKNEKKEKYLDVLAETNKSIANYLNFREKSFKEIETTQSNIKGLIPKIKEELNKPVNSQNELIKRLILSVVVITFFLAILRYFRSLYQSHYLEMLKAEQQDLIIRKFYVTLKSSEGNSGERKIVLASFLSDLTSQPNFDESQNNKNKSQKVENEVLRDLLNAILKKI